MEDLIKTTQNKDGKAYVKEVNYFSGLREVWKAPRRESNFFDKITEELNEIFCGRSYDEFLGSELHPHLKVIDQEYGICTAFIDLEWDPSMPIQNITNSAKLPLFFILEVWFRQCDRNMGTTRHLKVKSVSESTGILCPIDNGFSLMGIDRSQIETGLNLDPNSIQNLLASSFVTSWDEIESALNEVEAMPIEKMVGDAAGCILTDNNCTSETRQFIHDYAHTLIHYLSERRTLLRESIKIWWTQYKDATKTIENPPAAFA